MIEYISLMLFAFGCLLFPIAVIGLIIAMIQKKSKRTFAVLILISLIIIIVAIIISVICEFISISHMTLPDDTAKYLFQNLIEYVWNRI